ncbi:muscarinic acetylcholine receptor M1-like isoform X2 [Amphiura filiformis]
MSWTNGSEDIDFYYQSVTTTNRTLPHTPVALVFICISAFISQVLTIGGNILVMLSFRVERRLHKPSNYFLLSLAAADLIIGLFSMPVYSLYLIMGYWPFGSFVCDLWISIDYACSEVSVLNLIMISVDRLWSVKSPAKYRNKMTLRRATIMIIPTWILPTLLYFTSVIGWPYFVGENKRPTTECYLPFLIESPLFTCISTVVVYWIPITLMFLMYAYIFRIIRNLAKKKGRGSSGGGSGEARRGGSGNRGGENDSMRQRPLRSQRSNEHVYTPANTLEPPPMIGHGRLSDATASTTLSVDTSKLFQKKNNNSSPNNKKEHESEIEPSESTSSSDPSRNKKEESKPKSKNNKRSSMIKYRPGGTRCENRRGRSFRGERQSRSERKATRTLTFILGAFFVTWSPYSTIAIIYGYCPECVPVQLYHFSYYLCYINSTINPLCYAFANELFRSTFHKILTCKACKNM